MHLRVCEQCPLCLPLSLLHLLHQPRRPAGEPTGAGGLRSHHAGAGGPLRGHLRRAGPGEAIVAAGRKPEISDH